MNAQSGSPSSDDLRQFSTCIWSGDRKFYAHEMALHFPHAALVGLCKHLGRTVRDPRSRGCGGGECRAGVLRCDARQECRPPPCDLPAWRAKVLANGLACEPHPLAAAQPAADDLWLRNPDGTPVQLVIGPKVSPSGKRAPAGAPSQISAGIGAAPARSKVSPVQPSHLSHVLFFTPDVKRMVAFCRDVLGMRLSDHSGDLIAFVHGVHGSDHHLVAFAKSHAPGLHHSSWDVASINEVGLGSEQMRNAGHTQGWGVGRHVLGSNYFYYVRDPWGSYAEFSHDIDFVPADVDWPAADHPPHDSLYVWGPALPEDFITNHEQPAGAST